MYSSEFFPECYHVFRKDRRFIETNLSRGGGVLLACKDIFNVSCLDINADNCFCDLIDILGCKIQLEQKIVFIYVIYIPPQVSNQDFQLFFDYFENLLILQQNVIIVGDFNVPNLYKGNLCDTKSNIINNFLNFLNLGQLNVVTNNYNKLLDLVMSDLHCEVIRHTTPLVTEDNYHPALLINFQINTSKIIQFPCDVNHKAYNFKKANFNLLYDALLNVDWHFLNNFADVNDMCVQFYNKLYSLLDSYVPTYKTGNLKYPIWYNNDIIQNIKLKSYYYNLYKKFKSDFYYKEFSRMRALIKRKVSHAYNNYLINVQNNIKSDPKQFWNYIRSKKASSRIPGNVSFLNRRFSQPVDVVEGFADYFKSVFLPPSVDNIIVADFVTQCITLNSFSSNDILKSIKKLTNKMTAGHDQIPSFFIKDCSTIFVTPLTIIFNNILECEMFPEKWKEAKVCPILKSGDPADITNYRPISILNNFAKIFEMSVYEYLYSQLKSVIATHQHGFIERRSTISNLAEKTEFIANVINEQGQVDVVYTDFSKAFDTIDHRILCCKLEQYGFSSSLVALLRSYLYNRKQYVVYNSFKSKSYVATSGVPQGSNLGPLLFTIYINDLTSKLNCKSLLYADDLKIFSDIKGISDCLDLQSEINTVHSWCLANKLSMNVGKCKVCSYTYKKNIINYNYHYNNTQLIRCNEVKDLGVVFDSKLNFSVHINNIVSASLRLLGFIVRNCKAFTNITALDTLYFSLIRSKLEYGALIWNPIFNNYISNLENVQRKFLKFLSFRIDGVYPLRGTDHAQLLTRHNFTPLRTRRILISITFLFKLLHNLIDSPFLLSKVNFLVPRPSSRRQLAFYCNLARTNVMLRSPIYNICSIFNEISGLCDIYNLSLKIILVVANDYFK